MLKPLAAPPWLNDVELVEEHLEALKLSSAHIFRSSAMPRSSIVRSTAGLLGTRVASGRAYERRLRDAWERATRSRAS